MNGPGDALAKLLIEKDLITQAEFMQKLTADRARFRGCCRGGFRGERGRTESGGRGGRSKPEGERVRGEEPRPGYRITLRPKNRSAWS